jgi:hypothetical protein
MCVGLGAREKFGKFEIQLLFFSSRGEPSLSLSLSLSLKFKIHEARFFFESYTLYSHVLVWARERNLGNLKFNFFSSRGDLSLSLSLSLSLMFWFGREREIWGNLKFNSSCFLRGVTSLSLSLSLKFKVHEARFFLILYLILCLGI